MAVSGPISDKAVHRGARRQYERDTVNADVEVMEPRVMHGVVLNESDGGLRLALPGRLIPGARCLVRVEAAGRDQMLACTRVVWARQESDAWLVGLEFVEPC